MSNNNMLQDFLQVLHMSGYAVFVWSAFAMTMAVLIGVYCYVSSRLKAALKQQEEMNQAIKSQKSAQQLSPSPSEKINGGVG
ncbi:heme exporter protein CcmD [Ostreibacterium oceani]|uniref:Heme exporter protein D n=1 Tax=Ostreibacterium oceani TaxID=2654998 RepID=A0A6N7EX89_9GAMM|nr:heme exporter protein CcmD [Ostreibacterium oceani]MPV86019.1 heme exporter protein CcmD [Ostreibacterium oceani]